LGDVFEMFCVSVTYIMHYTIFHDCRLSDDNIISCNIARNAKDTIHPKLVEVGSQTHMCPAICQPLTSSTNCNSKFHSIPNNSHTCKSEQCDNCNSCISACDADNISIKPCQLDHKKPSICVSPSDDYSCSGESKNTTKCFGFFTCYTLSLRVNLYRFVCKLE